MKAVRAPQFSVMSLRYLLKLLCTKKYQKQHPGMQHSSLHTDLTEILRVRSRSPKPCVNHT